MNKLKNIPVGFTPAIADLLKAAARQSEIIGPDVTLVELTQLVEKRVEKPPQPFVAVQMTIKQINELRQAFLMGADDVALFTPNIEGMVREFDRKKF